MHAQQVLFGTVIEEHRGRTCVRFPVRHGSYNGLEENGAGSEKILYLTEPDFLHGIDVTLPHWSIVHDNTLSPQSLAGIMADIGFDKRRDDYSFAAIRLDGRSTVRHTYDGVTVWVELDTFINAAVRELRNRPSLALDSTFPRSEPFNKGFREHWGACILRLKGSK